MQHIRKSTILRASQIAACALMFATAGSARANWYKSYSSSTSYVAGFTKVPDFDQKRLALPNNGDMYCVPTAGMNWAAYFAHHGVPNQPPGDQNYLHWQWSPTGFNNISGHLATLGFLMGTDPNDGTSGSGGLNGLSAWMTPNVLVMRYSFSGGASPSFDKIAKWVLEGVPVTAGVGWYNGTEPVLTRDGGHAVSVVRVARNGSQRLLGIHDPGDDAMNLSTQSIFARQDYGCEQRLTLVGGVPRLMDKVLGYSNGYIDSYTIMIPMFSLGTSTDASKLVIKKFVHLPFEPWSVREVLSPGGALINDVASAPYEPTTYFGTAPVIGGQGARVFRYDHLLNQVFETDVEVADPRVLRTGRDGQLYVLDGNTVRCYDVSQQPEVQTATVFFGQVWTLAYNDVTAEVIVLVGDSILRLTSGLAVADPSVALPTALTLVGARSMSASPETGDLFLTSRGSPGIYHFPNSETTNSSLTAFDVIGAGQLTEPMDLTVGDDNRVYVSDNGVRKVFKKDDVTGLWSQDTSNPSHNQPANRRERTAYSRTNFDAASMVGPAFRNELPTEFAPSISVCLADLNDDGTVNGADLAALLSAWGTGAIDLNGDGATDGADLAALLAAWGQCPGQPGLFFPFRGE
jgi:hypothetical protein